MFVRMLPLLFALLWSTGFIGARFGLPYIKPFTFLAIRFLIAIVMLFGLIVFLKLKFPRFNRGYFHVIGSGLLIHAAYLGGVFYAIKIGLPVGDTAMVVGMQPILTVLVTHKSSLIKMLLASLLGFIGLLCVIYNSSSLFSVDWHMLLPALAALVGITFGTIYQKRKTNHQILQI